jgi:hypothetical protein
MAGINEIVREEVEKYASDGRGANVILFPVLDDARQIYTVAAVDYPKRVYEGGMVVVLARVVGDKVVIEEDGTNKPLLDALLQRGIPREKIVLAYQGEPIPDADRYELKGVKQATL